jgi:hypothetical protein
MRNIVDKEIIFPNKKIIWDKGSITQAEQASDTTSYFSLFVLAAESAPSGGWNKAGTSELGKRLELIDKLKNASGQIDLEENEYDLLKKCVEENVIINSTSKEAFEFMSYLDSVLKK